ncbi:MAG: hypothetical protein ACI9KE_003910 [Polyangiales bacterium]|jgi:hypothetical protein
MRIEGTFTTLNTMTRFVYAALTLSLLFGGLAEAQQVLDPWDRAAAPGAQTTPPPSPPRGCVVTASRSTGSANISPNGRFKRF